MKIFSDRLKQARGAMSQAAFSKAAGISRAALANYEADIREPDLSTLRCIAENVGVSTDWLLGLPATERGVSSNSATASPGAVVGNGAWRGADCASCPLMLAAAQTMKAVAAASSAPPRKKR
jgi:transcriptional regulator with XRE-family HTH domain